MDKIVEFKQKTNKTMENANETMKEALGVLQSNEVKKAKKLLVLQKSFASIMRNFEQLKGFYSEIDKLIQDQPVDGDLLKNFETATDELLKRLEIIENAIEELTQG